MQYEYATIFQYVRGQRAYLHSYTQIAHSIFSLLLFVCFVFDLFRRNSSQSEQNRSQPERKIEGEREEWREKPKQ